jgi:hypothetical protein
MRVQGTMANFTGGPVYNPNRASLPLTHQIGLGPHVSGYGPLPGGVRALATLHPGMCVQAQKTIISVVKTLWKRASPNDCVEVGLLCWGDAGIGPLTDAVMVSVDQAAVLLDVQWRTDLGDVIVRKVLMRFRGLADPLGHQELLEGVDHPFNLGPAKLFVNHPTVRSPGR